MSFCYALLFLSWSIVAFFRVCSYADEPSERLSFETKVIDAVMLQFPLEGCFRGLLIGLLCSCH